MEKNNDTKSTGIGFTGLLTICFIVLKLIGKIEWSWLWVLSPMWISFSIFVFVGIIVGILENVTKR